MEQEWKNQLRREASAHGMCRENRSALESIQTRDEAVALYKKTIDWALEEGYPNFGTIQRDCSDCEDLGVFVNRDFHGELLDDQKVYVFHHCSGIVRVGLNVPKKIIPMMYFANGCEMSILPNDIRGTDVRVPLYVFGKNLVKPAQSEVVSFKVYKFETK